MTSTNISFKMHRIQHKFTDILKETEERIAISHKQMDGNCLPYLKIDVQNPNKASNLGIDILKLKKQFLISAIKIFDTKKQQKLTTSYCHSIVKIEQEIIDKLNQYFRQLKDMRIINYVEFEEYKNKLFRLKLVPWSKTLFSGIDASSQELSLDKRKFTFILIRDFGQIIDFLEVANRKSKRQSKIISNIIILIDQYIRSLNYREQYGYYVSDFDLQLFSHIKLELDKYQKKNIRRINYQDIEKEKLSSILVQYQLNIERLVEEIKDSVSKEDMISVANSMLIIALNLYALANSHFNVDQIDNTENNETKRLMHKFNKATKKSKLIIVEKIKDVLSHQLRSCWRDIELYGLINKNKLLSDKIQLSSEKKILDKFFQIEEEIQSIDIKNISIETIENISKLDNVICSLKSDTDVLKDEFLKKLKHFEPCLSKEEQLMGFLLKCLFNTTKNEVTNIIRKELNVLLNNESKLSEQKYNIFFTNLANKLFTDSESIVFFCKNILSFSNLHSFLYLIRKWEDKEYKSILKLQSHLSEISYQNYPHDITKVLNHFHRVISYTKEDIKDKEIEYQQEKRKLLKDAINHTLHNFIQIKIDKQASSNVTKDKSEIAKNIENELDEQLKEVSWISLQVHSIEKEMIHYTCNISIPIDLNSDERFIKFINGGSLLAISIMKEIEDIETHTQIKLFISDNQKISWCNSTFGLLIDIKNDIAKVLGGYQMLLEESKKHRQDVEKVFSIKRAVDQCFVELEEEILSSNYKMITDKICTLKLQTIQSMYLFIENNFVEDLVQIYQVSIPRTTYSILDPLFKIYDHSKQYSADLNLSSIQIPNDILIQLKKLQYSKIMKFMYKIFIPKKVGGYDKINYFINNLNNQEFGSYLKALMIKVWVNSNKNYENDILVNNLLILMKRFTHEL